MFAVLLATFAHRLRNDLYCVGWGVKLYSLTHSLVNFIYVSSHKLC